VALGRLVVSGDFVSGAYLLWLALSDPLETGQVRLHPTSIPALFELFGAVLLAMTWQCPCAPVCTEMHTPPCDNHSDVIMLHGHAMGLCEVCIKFHLAHVYTSEPR
jgi:hypothetical protein